MIQSILQLNRRYWTTLIVFLLLVFLFTKRNHIRDFIFITSVKLGYNPHPERTFIPLKYPKVGVDISRYQLKFNWKKSKVINHLSDTIQLSFIIAKASEGTHLTDPYYSYNRKESKIHTYIAFGAYHYFLPNKDVQKQADLFIRTAQLEEGDLRPVIDIEETRGMNFEKIRTKLQEFCDILETHYGEKPIIYSNKDFLLKIIGEGFKDYPIWVAHYYEKEINLPGKWDWQIWQLTDKGSTFATQASVDINVINGGRFALNNLKL